MQDGRCGLINRGNLLERLMGWHVQQSETKERYIVGDMMKIRKEDEKMGGACIIGAQNVHITRVSMLIYIYE